MMSILDKRTENFAVIKIFCGGLTLLIDYSFCMYIIIQVH